MNFFSSSAAALFEFLFPKAPSLHALENMSAGDLVVSLPSAEPIRDEHIIAVFSYAHPAVREMIWELKYRGNRAVADTLAQVLYDVLSHELAERGAYENFRNPLLIPIPISDKRRLERGYNQTEILGQAIARLDHDRTLFEYDNQLLEKTTYTQSQARTHATRRERAENLDHSMRVPDAFRHKIQGRNIILLDDVTTSGATFAEARRALKEAGARKILCLAAAH